MYNFLYYYKLMLIYIKLKALRFEKDFIIYVLYIIKDIYLYYIHDY